MEDEYDKPCPIIPYKLLGLKPERGYVIFIPSGIFAYEMKLELIHIEMAIRGEILLIDATSMTMFNAKAGEWFKMGRLSEIRTHGKRITDNGCESEDIRIAAVDGEDEKPKKKRKASS